MHAAPRANAQYDIIVVGAGIVGLACAMRMLQLRPGIRLLVVDKEPAIGRHQTGHNSGVIHRGIYYTPGSLKARLCVDGAARLIGFCDEQEIPYRLCGKLIVAVDESELPALRELRRRGLENGVPGLRWLDGDEIGEVEPHCAGIAALHSPQTGIVDFGRVAGAYADEVRRLGGEVRLSREVRSIEVRDDGVRVHAGPERLSALGVVTCAGLQSDRLAAMTDAGADGLRVVPFRGAYYRLRPERASLVRGLIYPVPDARFPFLGVHFTLRMDGAVWAGPNAVLAFAREGYRWRDVAMADLRSTLGFGGFWRVARRYWRTAAAEMWRGVSRQAYAAALRRYVPELTSRDLLPGPSGVRAQAVAPDGSLVDDFVVGGSGRAIHVRNAPSPAATSSLAIADLICERFLAGVPEL